MATLISLVRGCAAQFVESDRRGIGNIQAVKDAGRGNESGRIAAFPHQPPQACAFRAECSRDVAPRQIISLMDLDGTTGNAGSFALPDHADHIHIGY